MALITRLLDKITHFLFPLVSIDGYNNTFLESFTAIKPAHLLHILSNKVNSSRTEKKIDITKATVNEIHVSGQGITVQLVRAGGIHYSLR